MFAWSWFVGLPRRNPEAEESPALLLWEQGQAAMRAGRTDEALGLYTESLKLDPALSRNYLSMSAGYLEKGDAETAVQHMDRYLHLEPEHHAVRAHYAELLLRLHRVPEGCGIRAVHCGHAGTAGR